MAVTSDPGQLSKVLQIGTFFSNLTKSHFRAHGCEKTACGEIISQTPNEACKVSAMTVPSNSRGCQGTEVTKQGAGYWNTTPWAESEDF